MSSAHVAASGVFLSATAYVIAEGRAPRIPPLVGRRWSPSEPIPAPGVAEPNPLDALRRSAEAAAAVGVFDDDRREVKRAA